MQRATLETQKATLETFSTLMVKTLLYYKIRQPGIKCSSMMLVKALTL